MDSHIPHLSSILLAGSIIDGSRTSKPCPLRDPGATARGACLDDVTVSGTPNLFLELWLFPHITWPLYLAYFYSTSL